MDIVSPHKTISTHTTFWWLVYVVILAGIDTSTFTANLTTAASTFWNKDNSQENLGDNCVTMHECFKKRV